MHEKAVLGTMFQIVFTPCLQIPLTYKDKISAKYPLVKNIPHLYPWNRGFEYPFSKMFIVYLHLQAVWPPPHLVATGKRKVRPFYSKNFIPHLYE